MTLPWLFLWPVLVLESLCLNVKCPTQPLVFGVELNGKNNFEDYSLSYTWVGLSHLKIIDQSDGVVVVDEI